MIVYPKTTRFVIPSDEFCRAQNEVPNNKICYMEVTNFAEPKMKSRITNSPRQAEGLGN